MEKKDYIKTAELLKVVSELDKRGKLELQEFLSKVLSLNRTQTQTKRINNANEHTKAIEKHINSIVKTNNYYTIDTRTQQAQNVADIYLVGKNNEAKTKIDVRGYVSTTEYLIKILNIHKNTCTRWKKIGIIKKKYYLIETAEKKKFEELGYNLNEIKNILEQNTELGI